MRTGNEQSWCIVFSMFSVVMMNAGKFIYISFVLAVGRPPSSGKCHLQYWTLLFLLTVLLFSLLPILGYFWVVVLIAAFSKPIITIERGRYQPYNKQICVQSCQLHILRTRAKIPWKMHRKIHQYRCLKILGVNKCVCMYVYAHLSGREGVVEQSYSKHISI